MLIAILEKKLGLMLADQDVYLNLAGGIRVVEPATDLAIATPKRHSSSYSHSAWCLSSMKMTASP